MGKGDWLHWLREVDDGRVLLDDQWRCNYGSMAILLPQDLAYPLECPHDFEPASSESRPCLLMNIRLLPVSGMVV